MIQKQDFLIILSSLSVFFGCAEAATLVENFDYGTSGIATLDDVGTTVDGWSGAWDGNVGNTYTADTGLSYTATGYTNDPNNVGTGAGIGVNNINRVTAQISRSLSANIGGAGKTTWISLLVNQSGDNAGTIAFEVNDTSNNLIRWEFKTNGEIEVRGAYSQDNNGDYDPDSTSLFLIKIEEDFSGELERTTLWVNPDLSSGAGGLTIANAINQNDDTNWITGGFDQIDLGITGDGEGNDGGLIDQIRISDEADAFTYVTAIPEPNATALLLGIGTLALVARRRSKS